MNYQKELVQTIKQSGYEGGTVKLVGGVPVDANNNPLLPDEKLQQLQAKYNMPVTQNPRQSINAAIQIRDAMSGVGGSQGGSGRANVSNSNDW